MKILVTAGPTLEPIDPVRFVSNRSTGAMGFAVARVARQRGHKVVLISGPTHLALPRGVDFFPAETARQMCRKVLDNFSWADAVVMAAAVSDYRPVKPAAGKIKKTSPVLNLKLARNPDILRILAKQKAGKVLAGFALETENLYKNSLGKLKEKNLDIIVANRLAKGKDVFGGKKTSVLILDKNGSKKFLSSVSKTRVAAELLREIEKIKAPQNSAT